MLVLATGNVRNFQRKQEGVMVRAYGVGCFITFSIQGDSYGLRQKKWHTVPRFGVLLIVLAVLEDDVNEKNEEKRFYFLYVINGVKLANSMGAKDNISSGG